MESERDICELSLIIISLSKVGKQFSTKLESTFVRYGLLGTGEEKVWRNGFSPCPGGKKALV